jgi:multidrug transporter EmrE-like cation transporter
MQGSHSLFLLLALLSVGASIASLELSQGLAKRLPVLAMFAFYILSLVCLTFALNLDGFALGLIYAAWSGVGIVATAAAGRFWKRDREWNGKETGPVGMIARVGLGLGFVGSVVLGQLATHLTPAAWILGLIAFPGLALAWHGWRVHRHPAPFHDSGPMSTALSVVLPVGLYLTWWYAPAFSAASDGVLVFLGLSMVLAALRGYGGCDMLAFSNWLLGRRDQLACAVFTPIDSLDWRNRRSDVLDVGGFAR